MSVWCRLTGLTSQVLDQRDTAQPELDIEKNSRCCHNAAGMTSVSSNLTSHLFNPALSRLVAMAQWEKCMRLTGQFLEQLKSLYGHRLPIEVRHYLASWMEAQSWSVSLTTIVAAFHFNCASVHHILFCCCVVGTLGYCVRWRGALVG